jgi:hypothetical protein
MFKFAVSVKIDKSTPFNGKVCMEVITEKEVYQKFDHTLPWWASIGVFGPSFELCSCNEAACGEYAQCNEQVPIALFAK